MNLGGLERRARRIRSLTAIRRWEYRQRHLSKGVWFRMRRVLAGARACWAIPAEEAERLAAEGWRPEPPGLELHPPRIMFFLPEERVHAIAGRRQLPVGLTAEFLCAPAVAMVRF